MYHKPQAVASAVLSGSCNAYEDMR